MRVLQAVERFLLTLWIGGMWAVGYIVVPLLFYLLQDRILAGQLAGHLFSLMSWLGLIVSIILFFLVLYHSPRPWFKSWQLWVLLTMLIFILVGEFVLLPAIEALKQTSPTKAYMTPRFALLHGAANVLFLIESLLGLALVVFGLSNG